MSLRVLGPGSFVREVSPFAFLSHAATRNGSLSVLFGVKRIQWYPFVPTILRQGPYRLFFYSSDHAEPVHVHVQREHATAKFWLEPIRLDRSGGFGRQELLDIQRILVDHQGQLIEAWHEYFGI